jgi:hypothetical protein
MTLNFVNITIGSIITALFYLVTSVIVREVGEFVMKLPESTLYKASKVSGVLSALIFLQFLLGSIWYLKEIILVIMLIVLFVMTHIVYELDWKESSIMASVCILVYLGILLLIAGAIYFTVNII